jgi:hypothetical protein
MATKKTRTQVVQTVSTQRIEKKILLLRGQNVMLDMDLADLYGVQTER